MERPYNIIIYLLILVLFNMVSSCRSHKNNTKDKDRNEYEQINSNFGIEISKNDNKRLYKEVEGWLGVPYKYGGHSKSGTDCSGMVLEIYLRVYNVPIQRNSAAIFDKNCKRIKKEELREGDLVFFSSNKSRINHVGLYLKNNKFVHASSSRGVIISDLAENYYVKHFYSAGRVH